LATPALVLETGDPESVAPLLSVTGMLSLAAVKVLVCSVSVTATGKGWPEPSGEVGSVVKLSA
jgi:hypothetical protein